METPSKPRRRDARHCRLLLTALLLAAPSFATTYVPVSDAELADQAAAIVQARIDAVEPAPIAGPPSTDLFLQVERVVKGHVAGSTVVLRLLGGTGPDGVGLRVWGAPIYRVGERALFFLEPRRDGTYGLLHLMLGAFREVPAAGRRLAIRDPGGAVDLVALESDADAEARQPAARRYRDFDRFVDWLSERARGVDSAADYRVAVDGLGQVGEARQPLFEDVCTRRNFRWFDFDRAGRVDWSVDRRGYDGAAAGRRLFAAAARLWSAGKRTPIRFSTAAAPAAPAGFTTFDGVNSVLFEDPAEEIPGAFSCAAGGVVAVSGIWFDNGHDPSCRLRQAGRQGVFKGRTFLRILGADIVANDGAGCLFAHSPAAAVDVLGHELGHTLGLSHLGGLDSLMSGSVLLEGRGSGLSRQDREALQSLYGW